MKYRINGRAPLALAVSLALATLTGTAFASVDSTRVIVAFKTGAAASLKTAAINAAGGQVKEAIFGMNALAIEVPAAALQALRNNPHVDYVEQDALRYPLALTSPSGPPYLSGQLVPYGIKLVQADLLPDTYAANRKVCIIDSGLARTHDDLSANTMSGEYDAGTGWWYTDENSHGTHVAGTIAAINNSGVGVVGVNANRQLKLHIVKVFGANGWAYSSSLASAANKCGAAGANVISMSLGGGSPNSTEQNVFAALQSKGVLSVAAAGNAGNSTITYPAGYSSVMMVGALDENKNWASFSQFNSKVEISAPGVSVLSTVPGSGGAGTPALTVGARVYAPGTMTGSPVKSATAPLADFGLGDRTTSTVAGRVCLIARGTVDFATKVRNCQNSGGVGAVIYNNVSGGFNGTLGSTVTTIPSVTVSNTDGTTLKSQLGQSATVAIKRNAYAYFNGTSMATPHVSGVAALVWSYFPSCTGNQIRASLGKSALDLGTLGRDTRFGYGLVQAKTAYDRIRTVGCGN